MCNWNFGVVLHVLIAFIVFSPGMPVRTSANETPADSLIDFPVLVASNDRHPDRAESAAVDRIIEKLQDGLRAQE